MALECDDCENDTFENMTHDYYAMSWRFECAECGSTVVVNEAE